MMLKMMQKVSKTQRLQMRWRKEDLKSRFVFKRTRRVTILPEEIQYVILQLFQSVSLGHKNPSSVGYKRICNLERLEIYFVSVGAPKLL